MNLKFKARLCCQNVASLLFFRPVSSVLLPSLRQARFLFLLGAGSSTGSSSLASQSMNGHIGPGLEESSLSSAIEDRSSQSTTSDSSLSYIGGWLKPRSVYDAETESVDFEEPIKKPRKHLPFKDQ